MTGPGAAPQGRQDAPARPARLLIVDDVSDNRAILGRRFERRGYEVVEADGGRRALELISQQSFDIVLLDWMMPEIDGPEVLRRIREQHSPVALPVIMVTAKTQSEDVVEALTLGANDYVAKPVDFAVAIARVEAQVGRKRAEEAVWRANAALSEANGDLERRIGERTAELVQANAQLREAIAEAQAANRAKDEFLTNMSHELRTPLNGVLGVAQVLAKTELTPEQREMVEMVVTSGAALQSVVSDLLDAVDLASGRVDLVPKPFALGDFVRDVVEGPAQKARDKGVSFAAVFGPEIEGKVEADPARLRQVLLHLLGNALKFTKTGEIRFSARRPEASPDRVVFEVSDTGVGFDEETAKRLFRRFEQADGSLTRPYGGLGIGLSICRDLIQQMNGEITAEGRPGQGAVFRVDLPLPALAGGSAPAREPADASAPAEAGAQRKPVRVLCAEDHPANRKLVEMVLRAAGAELVSVEDGARAVEAFKAQLFDIVLMDMQMPVMDGLDATRAIRALEASAGRPATPVIMLTAHGLPEHTRASREAGADRHMTKPLSPGDLLATINELVAQRAAAPVRSARSA